MTNEASSCLFEPHNEAFKSVGEVLSQVPVYCLGSEAAQPRGNERLGRAWSQEPDPWLCPNQLSDLRQVL